MNVDATTLKLSCRGRCAISRSSKAAGREIQHMVARLRKFECGHERFEWQSRFCFQCFPCIFFIIIVKIMVIIVITVKYNSACMD